MVLRLLCLCLLLAVTWPVQSWAAEPAAEEAAAAEVAGPVSPGLGEVGPRASALADFVAKSEEQLEQLAELSTPEESFAAISEQFKKAVEEMAPLGSPDDWYVDRLNHYSNRFGQIRQGLGGLQQRLADRQQATGKIREQAEKDKQFWASWEKELKTKDVELPKQTIAQVNKLLQQLASSLKTTSDKLLRLQEQVTALDRDILAVSEKLAHSLGKLRKATFRRNAYSFFSADYYRQFSRQLIGQIKDGVTAAVKFDPRYLQENGWRAGVVGLLVLTTI